MTVKGLKLGLTVNPALLDMGMPAPIKKKIFLQYKTEMDRMSHQQKKSDYPKILLSQNKILPQMKMQQIIPIVLKINVRIKKRNQTKRYRE